MNENVETLRQYYEKTLSRKHTPRTEFAANPTRIGANAVIAPGTLLAEGSIVKRGEVVDQYQAIKP